MEGKGRQKTRAVDLNEGNKQEGDRGNETRSGDLTRTNERREEETREASGHRTYPEQGGGGEKTLQFAMERGNAINMQPFLK
jgi:hypothetical protein